MKTLFKISWRNVWRNKLRSVVVIISIILGLWSGMFIMAMTLGLNEQRMSGAIESSLSHLQIHHPKFLEDYNKNDTIIDHARLLNELDTVSHIQAYTGRLVLQGMASTARGNYGVQILGIHPEKEEQVTNISQKLVEGTYFTRFKKNPIVIGQKLAEKLGVQLKSKVILNFQDAENNTIAMGFRVEGIFKSINSLFDEGTVFVKYEDLASVVNLTGQYHEIAIMCDKLENSELVKNQINTNNLVESWDQISPELGYAQETMSSFIYIFMGIILIALAFGIINTMLMAILERKHELGMLMSVGMNKRKIFSMILLETIFLALIATPLGILLSYWSISYFGKYGIDLSAVAKGLESLGVGARIYTELPGHLYINITIMTLIVALFSAIFPARRALKLKPAEAVKAL
jgi:ABC-type lipoprotein release transport system permease subunit